MSLSMHHPFHNEHVLIKINLYIISTHWKWKYQPCSDR